MTTRFGEDEPLDEGEVRRLLARIGEAESGGGHYATVGAVVEATGADLSVVSNELETIRADSFRAPLVVPPRVAAVTPAQVGLWIAVAIGVVAFLIAMGASAGSHIDAPETTFSTPVADGDVVFSPSRGVRVRKRDGTERAPTGDEEAMVLSLAAASRGLGR